MTRPPKKLRCVPAPATRAELLAKRCWVCGAPHPCFGFGPPLLPAGETVWACSAACVDTMEDAMIGAETGRDRMNALLALVA